MEWDDADAAKWIAPREVSIFFCVLMLDLNLGDMSCVYSSLEYIASQAQKNNVSPIMTFDQPLYLKALTVISSEHADGDLKSIILCLGTFHLQMSFFLATGYLMAGSSLQEIIELVYICPQCCSAHFVWKSICLCNPHTSAG